MPDDAHAPRRVLELQPDADGVLVLPILHEFENEHVEAFETRVTRLMERGLRVLVIDGRRIRGMGPMFPGSLIRTSMRLRERGGRLLIAYPNRTIRALFSPPDGEAILPVYETVEAALADV